VGVSAGASATSLVFSDPSFDADLDQQAITVLAGHSWPSHTSVRVAVGLVVDGTLTTADRRFDLGAGPLASAAISHQWSFAPWFVTGSFSLGASRVHTRETTAGATASARISLLAIDGRVAATAGRSFGPFSPYVLARAFGGPILWTFDGDDTRGTDAHHYQLGAGASLTLSDRLTFLVDIAALGERAASLGVAVNL